MEKDFDPVLFIVSNLQTCFTFSCSISTCLSCNKELNLLGPLTTTQLYMFGLIKSDELKTSRIRCRRDFSDKMESISAV